jgi:hypothetical protein
MPSLKTPPKPLAYTIDEIPQAARIGISKIKEEIAAGELPIVKIGNRTLVLDEDLRAYLARHRVTRGSGSEATPGAAPETPPSASSAVADRPRRRERPPRIDKTMTTPQR